MNKKILIILVALLAFCIDLRAEIHTGSCGNDLTWAFNAETGILAISGTGAMTDYSYSNQPWDSYKGKITSIKINQGVTSIGKYAFYSVGKYNAVLTVSIANSVTEIKDYAFMYCRYLESISIPGSVVNIGKSAFENCFSLKKVYLNNGLKKIGANAWSDCGDLESITIPQSVTSIGHVPFSMCESLKSISVASGNEVYYAKNNCLVAKENGFLIAGCKNSTIPEGVTCIGSCAFWGSYLTSLSLPSSTQRIESNAFRGCDFTSLYIPANVSYIETNAFAYCDGIETLSVDPNNQTFYAENNCIIENNSKKIVLGCKNSVIPSNVTSIGASAFEGCNGLTSIIIPENVTSIGQGAFNCCDGLTHVSIPNSVTTIPGYAFQACPLKTIVIGKSVTSIGSVAFLGCNEITDIYCLAKKVPTTVSLSFSTLDSDVRIHVPYSLETAYLTTSPWCNATIIPEEFLIDGYDSFKNTTNAELKAITYTRTLSKTNTWNALYVPFEIPMTAEFCQNYDVAYFNDVHCYDNYIGEKEDGVLGQDGVIDGMDMEVLQAQEGSVLKANYPYLIRAKNTSALNMNIKVEDATLYKAKETTVSCSSVFMKFDVTGIYTTKTAGELKGEFDVYAISGGGWKQALNANQKLNPFRLYLKLTSIDGSPVKATEGAMSRINIRVHGEDTETGILEMESEDENKTETFDLSGRRVQKAQKGLYIVNGKKVIK